MGGIVKNLKEGKKMNSIMFAQAATGSTNVVENVTAVANGVADAVGGAANAAAPVIIAVVGIGISLWIIPTIVGLIKRAFSTGKGR